MIGRMTCSPRTPMLSWIGRPKQCHRRIDGQTLEPVSRSLDPPEAVSNAALTRLTIRTMIDVVLLATKPVAWYVMRAKGFLIQLMISISLHLPLANEIMRPTRSKESNGV